MMTTADTTGYVGPRLRATAPDTYEAILDSAENGEVWIEHGQPYCTCAGTACCHLERPVAVMVQVGGRYYCPDEAPDRCPVCKTRHYNACPVLWGGTPERPDEAPKEK